MDICDLFPIPNDKDIDALSDWFALCEKWGKENNEIDMKQDAWTALQHIANEHFRQKYRLLLSSKIKALRKDCMNMDSKHRIFIAHGHDSALKEHTARLVERLGFKPIILSEQANKGKTIIEKLEHYSDVRFAIVLYSADDEMNTGEWRGRQNVVFEHGLFIGKLNRENVMCIKEQGVELPGDIDGTVYTDSRSFDMDVAKELSAAGFDVDMNKLM